MVWLSLCEGEDESDWIGRLAGRPICVFGLLKDRALGPADRGFPPESGRALPYRSAVPPPRPEIRTCPASALSQGRIGTEALGDTFTSQGAEKRRSRWELKELAAEYRVALQAAPDVRRRLDGSGAPWRSSSALSEPLSEPPDSAF